jgi:hypothetical protein
VQAVPAGTAQLSRASSQVSAHSGPPAHGSPAWTLQVSAPHVSAPLQWSPSSHGAALAVETQPPGVHASSVQALPSSHSALVVHAGASGGGGPSGGVDESSPQPGASTRQIPAIPAISRKRAIVTHHPRTAIGRTRDTAGRL